MSKPRYHWWGYIKAVIRAYPSGEGLTEKEREAVRLAVEQTQKLPDGRFRMLVVDLVFFRQTHTLEGAAQQVPCSYTTAKRYHNSFICEVARHCGFPINWK